jgi:50S ribosomal subunit-associated GTPase HflX
MRSLNPLVGTAVVLKQTIKTATGFPLTLAESLDRTLENVLSSLLLLLVLRAFRPEHGTEQQCEGQVLQQCCTQQ